MAPNRVSPSPIITPRYNQERNNLQVLINECLLTIRTANSRINGVEEAYSKIFTDLESKYGFSPVTREKIYAAIIVYNQANGGLPPTINELINHIKTHYQLFIHFDMDSIKKYYTEFCTTRLVIDADGQTYNIAKIHEHGEIAEPIVYNLWDIKDVAADIQAALISLNYEINFIEPIIEGSEPPHLSYKSCGQKVFNILENLTSSATIINKADIDQYKNELKQILHKNTYVTRYEILRYSFNKASNQANFTVRSELIVIISKFISFDIHAIQSHDDLKLAEYLEMMINDFIRFLSARTTSRLYFNLAMQMLEYGMYIMPKQITMNEYQINEIIKLLNYKINQELSLTKANIVIIDKIKYTKQVIQRYFMYNKTHNAPILSKIKHITNEIFKKYIKLVQDDSIDLSYITESIESCNDLLLLTMMLTNEPTNRKYDLLTTTICRRLIRDLSNISTINTHTIIYLNQISNALIKLEPITGTQKSTAIKRFFDVIYIYFNKVNENDKIQICSLVVELLNYKIELSNETHRNIENMIDFLFQRNMQFAAQHFITPQTTKYISDQTLINHYTYLIHERRRTFILPLESREKIKIIIQEANIRGLFITSEMPPLIAEIRMYDETLTGTAYQIHKLRNIIPYLRKVVITLIQSSQINVANETMLYEEIFNKLIHEIDRLLPPDTNERKNKLARAALLRIFWARNITAGHQFFADLPYLLALVIYDNFGWREGFKSYDARVLNLLLSLIDSAEAYGVIENLNDNVNTSMSCPEGIFERMYFALQPLSETFNLLFYVQATGRTCVEVYNMLATLLNKDEFKQTTARNTVLLNYQEEITIPVVIKAIIITISQIEQERIKILIDNYLQNSQLDSSLTEDINKITEEFWREIEIELVKHLQTNLNTMCEAYEDSEQDYDPFHFREIMSLVQNLV